MALPGYTRLYLAVLGCTWLSLTVLGCTLLFVAVLGCTRLYLAELGCTWSVLKGLKTFGTIKPKCYGMGLGYLQTGPFLDHLAVIIKSIQYSGEFSSEGEVKICAT